METAMEHLHSRRRFLFAASALALVAVGTASVAIAAEPAAVDELLAKQAITELIYKYPRGLDRLDRDLLMSIGFADAKVEFGTMPVQTWPQYVDWLIKAHDEMLGNNHRITNILIEIQGDRAVSESSGTATLLVAVKGNSDMFEERWMHSRYLDTWARRNGRWGLVNRQTLIDYRRVNLVPAADVKSRYQILPRTGRADPSYKLFTPQP
jgi:hypothetical protein